MTVKEFHNLGDRGVFEGRRAKLIHGVIVEEGMMSPAHATAIVLVTEALRATFRNGWRFCIQLPLVFGPTTDPVPDVAVVRGSVRGTSVHPTTAELVVEVADSSLNYDTTVKAELYATAGIPDYWVIDVENRQLHVFRDPVPLPEGLGATAYRSHVTLAATDSASPLAVPDRSIRVAEMLP